MVLIARVAQSLHGAITPQSVGTFLVLFGPLSVGWFNGTLLHDAHGRPDVGNRLLPSRLVGRVGLEPTTQGL